MEGRAPDSGQGEMRRCPYCHELIYADAVKCRYCRSDVDPSEDSKQARGGPSGKMLLGVCSRLAARYQIPVTVVRLAFVLLTLFHGFGVFLYLILWAILPGLSEGEEPKASHWIRSVRRFFWAVKKAFHEEVASAKGGTGTGTNEVEEAKGVNTAQSR
jgi:phage shock protein PspC (stress-responsive transcriptional regulator)